MKFVIEEEDLKDLVAHLKRSKGEMYRTHFTEFNRVRCNGNLNSALKIIKEKHHPLAEEISQPKVKTNTLIKKEILLEELLHQIDSMMDFLLTCSKSSSNIDMDKFKPQYTEVLNSINKYAAHNNIKFRKINGINGIEKLESALKNKDAFTAVFQLKRINEFLIDSAKMEKEINPTHGLYAKDLITHECEFIESNPRNEYPIIDNIPRLIEVIKHVPIPNDVRELAAEHLTHLMNASTHDINSVAEGSYRAGYQDGIADLMGSLIKANLIDKNIVIDVDDMFEDEDYC